MLTALDRSTPPRINEISAPDLPEIVIQKLHNSIPLYRVNGGDQNVLRLEMIFKAGKWFQPKEGVSLYTAKMLKEGTSNFSSAEIAEKFDNLGASIRIKSDTYFISIQVHTLNKYLKEILELVSEIITKPAFDNAELDIHKSIGKQNLKVNLEKVEYLANSKFSGTIFGNEHPFGYTMTKEIIDDISTNDLQKFHGDFCHLGNVICFISGKIPANAEEQLNEFLGSLNNQKNASQISDLDYEKIPSNDRFHFVNKKGANQCAIRIGKTLPDRSHKDYAGLQFLNTVLGGYFGSRLMRNIREEKGFTYGIYSGITPYADFSIFRISTEVGSHIYKQAIDEIGIEISRLKNELIPDEELQLVRNYLLGNQLNALDGAFKSMDVISSLIVWQLGYDYFYNKIAVFKHITASELQELAVKYLHADSMYTAIAGSK